MTRMTSQAEQKRAAMENALTSIGTARILIDTQVMLRVRQAMRRDSQLVDLLEPVLAHVDTVDRTLVKALKVIGAEWETHEHQGW